MIKNPRQAIGLPTIIFSKKKKTYRQLIFLFDLSNHVNDTFWTKLRYGTLDAVH